MGPISEALTADRAREAKGQSDIHTVQQMKSKPIRRPQGQRWGRDQRWRARSYCRRWQYFQVGWFSWPLLEGFLEMPTCFFSLLPTTETCRAQTRHCEISVEPTPQWRLSPMLTVNSRAVHARLQSSLEELDICASILARVLRLARERIGTHGRAWCIHCK